MITVERSSFSSLGEYVAEQNADERCHMEEHLQRALKQVWDPHYY